MTGPVGVGGVGGVPLRTAERWLTAYLTRGAAGFGAAGPAPRISRSSTTGTMPANTQLSKLVSGLPIWTDGAKTACEVIEEYTAAGNDSPNDSYGPRPPNPSWPRSAADSGRPSTGHQSILHPGFGGEMLCTSSTHTTLGNRVGRRDVPSNPGG
jgi:hypothetical protein